MSVRSGWAGWACVGLLLCSGCGRIGFDLLNPESHPPPRKKPTTTDAAVDARVGAQLDAGDDSGTPASTMDAAVDASRSATDSGARDAAATVDASVDATADGAKDAARNQTDATATVDAASDSGPRDAASGCTATQVADYCTELPRLPVAPQIDGQLECDLQLHDIVPAAWTNAASPIPAGHSARFAAAWRDDGVYFFVDVTDDTRLPPAAGSDVWCGDGAELYVDSDAAYAAPPMYDAPGSIQVLAAAPADDTTPVSSGGQRYRAPGGLVGPWSSPRYATFPRPGGYVFEAFIQADDLDLTSWTLMSGASVGLDLAINVSVSSDPPPTGETAECGRRLGQYFLRIAPAPCTTSCLPFQDVAAFCAPVLRE